MARSGLRPAWKWTLTALTGAAIAAAFWVFQGQGGQPQGALGTQDASHRLVASPGVAVALRYAEALQVGDCAEVIALTAWMRERLRAAERAAPGEATPEEVRRELCERIQDRRVEGNRLRPEGVEDRYVFAPGTELEPRRVDEGRGDLSSPVRERVWIRVTFPEPVRALCDAEGRPLRSVEVGLNVSPDGLVVKAAVIGNLEVRLDAASYEGRPDQGG